MRGHNICFHREIRKIVFQLSSIPPLIWSSGILKPLTLLHLEGLNLHGVLAILSTIGFTSILHLFSSEMLSKVGLLCLEIC